jgi:hypothetical protein
LRRRAFDEFILFRAVVTPFIFPPGAKVLKEVSTEDGQDVAAVADVDGYTLTLVDMKEYNAQLA